MNHLTSNPLPFRPSFFKLAACLLYELLAIIALSLVFAGLFYALFGDATHGNKRFSLQLFLWVVLGAYYVRCWVARGQTLAMQAWRFRVVLQNDAPLTEAVALTRYVLASLGLAVFGVGFLWALLDNDRLFLHDRLLKLKIITV